MDRVLTAIERTALPKRLALPASGERAALVRKRKGSLVRKRVQASFDPKIFLANVGEGKTISTYRKDQVVFSQGQVADAVFYIQQGEIKLTVVSEQGKEAAVAILKTQVPQRPAFLLVEFKSSYDTHSSWYIMVSVSLVCVSR